MKMAGAACAWFRKKDQGTSLIRKVSNLKMCDLAKETGDKTAARDWYERGLSLVERLAAADPDNFDLQIDLRRFCDKLGNLADRARDSEGPLALVLSAYRRSKRLYGMSIRAKSISASMATANPIFAYGWEESELRCVGDTSRLRFLVSLLFLGCSSRALAQNDMLASSLRHLAA